MAVHQHVTEEMEGPASKRTGLGPKKGYVFFFFFFFFFLSFEGCTLVI